MPEATPFRVLIVDDHPLMRRGISQLLQLDPAFDVVAEAGDGASAIDLANRLDLDVILLDLNMPRMNGLEFLEQLRHEAELSSSVVFVLTTSSADEDKVAAYQHHVAGYIVKHHIKDEFISIFNMLENYWRIVVLPPDAG